MNPSGFVPDNVQPFETMIEPDESGYPSAQKRTRFNSYGVSKEVISLSNMSSSEKKNLAHKLKMELEQIKELRKKIEFASVMKECETLLSDLCSHKFGWGFRTPVDPVLLNLPDYFTVIKHPMDLGTIGSKLRKEEYSNPLEFASDVRLTFSNCMVYNPPGNSYYTMALGLSKFFESKWKVIEKKIPVIEPPAKLLTSSASLESAVNERKLRVEPAKLVMRDDEKIRLGRDLEALEDIPQSIIDVLKEHNGSDGQNGDVDIEIDIDTISSETLVMVRKLLDDYLREKKKSGSSSSSCLE